jgi:hypothetical protein
MADTVTLALQGETVGLDEFADAIARFARLVVSLSREAKAPGLGWEIDELDAGSAITTVRANLNGYQPQQVEQVVRSFLEVGRALQEGQTIPFPDPVKRDAEGIADLLRAKNTQIEEIRFETAEDEAIVRERLPLPHQAEKQPVVRAAYGAVTGRIQTLSSRSRLRFTLYDRLHDRPVSCYLSEGREEQVRDAWDKYATVQGWVSRDSEGRPTAIRRITLIRALGLTEEGDPSGYTRARGVLARAENEARAEDRVRQIRDAG